MKVPALAKASEHVSEGTSAAVQRRVNLRWISTCHKPDPGIANAEDCAGGGPSEFLHKPELPPTAAFGKD